MVQDHEEENNSLQEAEEAERNRADDEEISQRLFQAISAKKLKIKQFARESGIKYPSLRDYYKGKRKPGFLALAALLKFTGVSGDWLLLGKGEMFAHDGPLSADVDEHLFAKIAQAVTREFLKQPTDWNEADQVRETGGDYLNKKSRKQMQSELNRIGEHTAIAANIYNRAARLAAQERADYIQREVARLVRLHRSISLTHIDDDEDGD